MNWRILRLRIFLLKIRSSYFLLHQEGGGGLRRLRNGIPSARGPSAATAACTVDRMTEKKEKKNQNGPTWNCKKLFSSRKSIRLISCLRFSESFSSSFFFFSPDVEAETASCLIGSRKFQTKNGRHWGSRTIRNQSQPKCPTRAEWHRGNVGASNPAAPGSNLGIRAIFQARHIKEDND